MVPALTTPITRELSECLGIDLSSVSVRESGEAVKGTKRSWPVRAREKRRRARKGEAFTLHNMRSGEEGKRLSEDWLLPKQTSPRANI